MRSARTGPNLTDRDLLTELGVSLEPEKLALHTPRQERLLAGFEDIQRFVAEHRRHPTHAPDADIFERLYAVRLDRLRALPEAHDLLGPLDHDGLLGKPTYHLPAPSLPLDDAALLAELEPAMQPPGHVAVLRHVSSPEERRVAEEIADRTPAQDFARFKPLFAQVEHDLATGIRSARRFGKDAAINLGDFFLLVGQFALVAEMGEPIKAPNGESDARLRVIYSNGTQSNLLRRSLQRALYKDKTGRRLTDPNLGPLFPGSPQQDAP